MKEQSDVNSFGLIAALFVAVFCCALLGLTEVLISAYQRAGWLGIILLSLLIVWLGYEVKRA